MAAKYAQHFLINSHAAERIVQSMELTPEDSVLEIGPGKGALTSFLLKAKNITVVEIDVEMVQLLRARFGSVPQVQIIQSDVLKFDFKTLAALSTTKNGFKVVGNLPYNLTSPILRRLSDWDGWSTAFIMVQKEVADRLCAKPSTPDYGALTAGMSLTCEAEFVFELSETSFKPPPRVKSGVVKLIRRLVPLTPDIDRAQQIIQAAFQQRRKTILNSLSHGLGLEKEQVQSVLEKLEVDPGLRAERIPVEMFVKLSAALPRTPASQ